MPVPDLMWEGLKLMVLGMGIVFFFLGSLVACVQVMTWLVRRHEVVEAGRMPAAAGGDDESVVAVISAAVERYRRDHGR